MSDSRLVSSGGGGGSAAVQVIPQPLVSKEVGNSIVSLLDVSLTPPTVNAVAEITITNNSTAQDIQVNLWMTPDATAGTGGLSFVFDILNKFAVIPVAEAKPLDVDDIWLALREYEANHIGIWQKALVFASGLANLGGSKSVSLTLKMLDGWKLDFDGTDEVTVENGNFIAETGSAFKTDLGDIIINNQSADAVIVAPPEPTII